MRHTTATHGGHAPNQATKQVATNPHTQSSGQRRTGTSGRQPVLYGPELKIIHTARTRPPAAKMAQPKHISEMIPATKVIQTAQAATATPQSPVKNQPRASTGVAQTTPQRPAHQPATPQKTTVPHRATTPTAHITKHHRPVAVQPITSSRPNTPRQLRKRQPVTISPLSAQPTRPSSPRAQTPHHTAQHTSTQPGAPRSMDFVFVPSEVEPPSAAKHQSTPPPSQLARVLATEQADQTQTQTTQPAIPIGLPTLNLAELAAQPLVAQPSGMPQGEVWWPPAEPELTTTENIPVGTLPRSVLTQQSKKLAATPTSKRRRLFASKRRTNKPTASVAPPPARQPAAHHWGRRLSIAGAMVALLAFGGYLTYHNMPAIATRMAAAQAGINASFPSYQPSGYSLAGGISQQQGSVLMKFAANAGPGTFTLTQSRSDWDSSAVLANYVLPSFGRNFATTTSRGLTIYSTHNAAAWVNGGILYTIKGNAPLSSEQVERIAASM